MPHDEENGTNERSSLLGRGHQTVRRFWEGFIDFAFQGNILQIAFGLMCACTILAPWGKLLNCLVL